MAPVERQTATAGTETKEEVSEEDMKLLKLIKLAKESGLV